LIGAGTRSIRTRSSQVETGKIRPRLSRSTGSAAGRREAHRAFLKIRGNFREAIRHKIVAFSSCGTPQQFDFIM
jgi:hypothetical protein